MAKWRSNSGPARSISNPARNFNFNYKGHNSQVLNSVRLCDDVGVSQSMNCSGVRFGVGPSFSGDMFSPEEVSHLQQILQSYPATSSISASATAVVSFSICPDMSS